MAALLNLTNASWKRQPIGRVNINPKFMGTQQIYVCPSVSTRSDVSGGRVGSISGTLGSFSTDSVGIGIKTSNITDRWVTQGSSGISIPLANTKCFFAYFTYIDGPSEAHVISTSTWGIFLKAATVSGRCGCWQGSAYVSFNFTLKTNALHCLMVIHKNSTLYCFLNGRLVGSFNHGSNPLALSNSVFTVNNYTAYNMAPVSTTYLAGLTNADLFSAANELTTNPWIIFSPEKSLFYLIPDGGGLSAVYQDGLIRWNLLAEVQQDASLKWDVATTVHNDQVVRWNLLEGVLSEFSVRWNLLVDVQQDITARWDTLTTAQQEVIVRWNALDSVQQNHTLRWDVLSSLLSVQNDVVLRWDALSAVQQDALLRWNLANEVAQSLTSRWNLLKSVEISQDLRWDIAVEVANQIALRWDLLASLTAENDLTLRWNLLAIAENEIELRWIVGDQLQIQTMEAHILLVRGEDRVFKVSINDRAFDVNFSDRTIGAI